MKHHLPSRSQPFQYFRHAVVAMTDLDRRRLRASIFHDEHRPVLALPEQRAYRHCQDIVRAPDRRMHDDAVVMPQPRPKRRWIGEVDGNPNPLLLDAERGDLEEAGGVDTNHLPPYRRTTPAIGPGGDERFNVKKEGNTEPDLWVRLYRLEF